MKVYIATYHREINYGAALQAFALQHCLSKLGWDSRLILFQGSMQKEKSRLNNWKDAVNLLYNRIFRKKIETEYIRYEDFFKKYHKTTETYADLEDIKRNPPTDGVYLAGSDQIFNMTKLLPEFFLQFGPKEIRRISYAASVGISDIPEEKKALFRQYLSSFDSLSIRELKSKEMVSRYTDQQISVNIDPTYLVPKDTWAGIQSNLAANRIEGDYILVYSLYRPDWMNRVLRKIRRQTHCKIVLLSTKGFRPVVHDQCIIEAGPLEFLGLIANAKGIISSSYHGCVFSTIYEKPFLAVLNPAAPHRIQSLLDLFHLEDREMTEDSEGFDFRINYDYMRTKLQEERKKSQDYLTSALGEQDEHCNDC